MLSVSGNNYLFIKRVSRTSGVPDINHRIEKFAIITGATSGIGKTFAFHLAQRGLNLIITGRKHQLLNEIANQLKSKYGIKVIEIVADLAVKEDVLYLLRTIDRVKNIDILINNAGYGVTKKFHQDDISNHLKILQVHVTTPMMLIHKVLESMKREGHGKIINVCSLAALTPTSENTMYSSTKSFLYSFTLSLQMELKKYGISVQCLCPGFTRTDFHNKLGIDSLEKHTFWAGWMDAEEVVKYSLNSLENGKVLCVPGRFNRIIMVVLSIIPMEWKSAVTDQIGKRFFRSLTKA